MNKNNTAFCDPSYADDATSGYSIGSEWLNTKTGIVWVCLDNTAGTAVWRQHTQGYGWPSQTYRVPDYITAVADGQPAAGVAVYLPMLITEITPIDKVGVALTTAQAGAKVRLGLYYGVDGVPDALRKDFGELDLSAGSGLVVISTGAVLQPGLYFLAAVFNAAGTQPTVKRVSGAQYGVIKGGSGADLTSGNAGRYYTASVAYGALAGIAPTVTAGSGTDGVAIALRKS